jgi:hypothetical protein
MMFATTGFEADLCPDTRAPRMRFNFVNGWSASIVLQMMSRDGCRALMASVAAAPTGEWGTGKTVLGPTEASADEAMAWIDDIRVREAV